MRMRSIWRPWKWASLVLTGGLLVGCSTSEKTLQYLGETELQHYKDVALTIDYPDVNQESLDEVSNTDEPRRIRNPSKDPVWNVSLEEVLHTALENSEIIRDNGQFLSPGNRLLSNPDFVQSMYDPAIQDTSTLFGQNGVEAALSEFDANFTANMTWGRSENLAETSNFGGIGAGNTVANEAGDFRAAITKIFADGGQASLTHSVLYSGFNGNAGPGQNRLFNSSYSNNPSAGQNGGTPGLELDYRRPLWAGGGTEFTRIAGPISRRPTLQNVPQVNQGVVISRIRTDLALAEFEQSVIGLAKDVEDVYWELYLAYRRYDAELVARNSSLSTWRQVKAKADEGLEGGGAADEAQARDSYYEIRARSEDALANLYNSEGRLRRLMGLAVNDNRIIRPSDEPTTAEFLPDWRTSLCEALTHRVELRKQKWNIKSLEFQLQAAKSLAQPRLDFVSRYQINGLGDQLFGDSNDPGTAVPGSYYQNLLSGQQTGWGLGFEFSMPIGFRAANSQIRNIELRLSKARAALGIQEHEISHELANAFRQLDSTFQITQTTFNRRRAAERRVQANDTQYKAGKGSVDLLLRSQISLAQAEVAYYQSLVGYNRAIVEMKYRKGTLLDNDNVRLSESLSHPESYAQALRHAWARSHAFDARHLDTKPGEFWTDPAETGTANYSASGISEPLPPEPKPADALPDTNSAPMTNEAPHPTQRDSIPLPPQETPDAKGAKLIPVDEELLPVASKRDLPKVPEPSNRQVESSLENLRSSI
jgi:outer membrane protein TolC